MARDNDTYIYVRVSRDIRGILFFFWATTGCYSSVRLTAYRGPKFMKFNLREFWCDTKKLRGHVRTKKVTLNFPGQPAMHKIIEIAFVTLTNVYYLYISDILLYHYHSGLYKCDNTANIIKIYNICLLYTYYYTYYYNYLFSTTQPTFPSTALRYTYFLMSDLGFTGC